MQEVMEITEKRRALQDEYNEKHGITPKTIFSSIKDFAVSSKKAVENEKVENVAARIKRLELEMDVYAANLEFEKAAAVRDALLELKKKRR